MAEAQSHESLYQEARILFESQQFKKAIRKLALIRHDQQYSLKASSNIGSCLLLMGLARPAKKFIERALAQDSTYAPALINLGELFLLEEDFASAESIFRQIVEDHPEQEKAWLGLARALSARKDDTQALQAVKDFLARFPASYDGYLLQGELLSNQDNHTEAIKALGKALDINPKKETAYAHLSVVMVRQKNYEPALRYIEKALGIKAESLINNCRKAQILLLMAHAKEAAECYIKAYHLDPTSAINFLNHHLVLPGIPSNSQDIEEARARFEAGLGLAENNALIQLRLDEDINPHIFELAYHNQDDRILLERYHALMNKLSNPIVSRIKASVSSSNQSTPEAGNSKVRIGFLSKFFSGHSNTLAFEGLICNLDRANFEVFLIHADGSKKDERRDSLDLVCDHSVQLNANYAEAYQTLVSLKLDILFFTDLGMNGWDFLIPLFRAAPIQMTGWGIPHTSGIREIDYYISSERLEPVGAESSYTEKLIKLPGGLPCCFLSESLDFTPLPRDYFFLPPGGTLFGCLQGLHKLHPDFDFILEAIAQANPDAGFVFVEDSVASRTKIFLDRLSRNAPTARERCITLAIMSRQEYHSICHGLDILLDPIYYGSGITFFEASFVGAPIVTMEGNALRSRVVACGYREMGLEHPPIATSAKEYVEIATTLANNIGRRQSLRNEILSKNHLIFNRMSYVRDFEKFCLDKVYSIRDHLAII